MWEPRPARPAGLSVCCLTRGPTARVAAQLRLLRDVAHEIVVAVDDRADETLLGPLEEVADVLVRYPWADPVDRPVGWVHSLCSRDWILWVDDDEIASRALLRVLPELLRSPQVTHCHLPRRTLFRDAATCLDGPPWVPDYQLRLVENDPRLLWFPGVTHWPIEAAGPGRYLDAPLYHTDLLLNPLERREQKVRRYEQALPGRRVAGLPMNDAYFLPEHRDAVRTMRIAEEDVSTVERVLAEEPWPEPAPSRRPAPLAGRTEIDAHWRGAPADDSLYRARLTLLDPPDPMVCGEKRALTLRVENLGSQHWPWGTLGSPEIRLSYRWLAGDGTVLVRDGLRTPLPEPLAPGAGCLVPVDVTAPETAGTHTLALDLVHERVRWFGCSVRALLQIRPGRRVAILADDERLAAAAAAALAEHAPAVEPLVLASDPQAVGERIGYPAVPGAREYVLETNATPSGRLRGRAEVVARTAALLAEAGRLRRGGRPRLLAPAGREFLERLRRVDGLLVAGDGLLRSERGARESWHYAVTLLAAEVLGLPVVIVGGGDGALTAPARLARSRATFVAATPGAGEHDALPEAVRRLVGRLGA